MLEPRKNKNQNNSVTKNTERESVKQEAKGRGEKNPNKDTAKPPKNNPSSQKNK